MRRCISELNADLFVKVFVGSILLSIFFQKKGRFLFGKIWWFLLDYAYADNGEDDSGDDDDVDDVHDCDEVDDN